MSCSSCPSNATRDNNIASKTETSCGTFNSHDWLSDLPQGANAGNIVEVSFKNTHKEFFINDKELDIKRGDYIAVAADKGHDIGQVSLTGTVAGLQLKRKNPRTAPEKVVYRKATHSDIEKWQKARLLEKPTLIKARQIADNIGLEMKISDVEYQGDGTKAIFYYIANGRVDFRELIKHYAREFRIKIEMRQIGVRQEAGMVGGIGSCGKELCCSTWRTNLTSVYTNAAKIQELPHNVQKLTGQCGKLKCCLMYELDTYLEAQEEFPDLLLELEMDKGMAYPKKRDVLKRKIFYSYEGKSSNQLVEVPLNRVKEIIQLNKKGIKPVDLVEEETTVKELNFVSAQSDLTDVKEGKNKKRRKHKPHHQKFKKKQQAASNQKSDESNNKGKRKISRRVKKQGE